MYGFWFLSTTFLERTEAAYRSQNLQKRTTYERYSNGSVASQESFLPKTGKRAVQKALLLSAFKKGLTLRKRAKRLMAVSIPNSCDPAATSRTIH